MCRYIQRKHLYNLKIHSNIYNKANEFYELTGYPVDLNIVVEIKNEVNVDDYEKNENDKWGSALVQIFAEAYPEKSKQ